MNDPRIPALLVSHRRPGFYFRVLEEGDVEAGDDIVKVAVRARGDGGRRGRRAALPPRAHASAAPPGPADPGPQPRLAGVVPSAAGRRPGQRQRRPRGDEPSARLAGLPPADGHRHHTGERLGRLDPPGGSRGRARARPAPRPVPDAARPARRGRSDRCCATTPSPDRRTAASTGSPSSASATAPPAATCTPGSPSATRSTSRRRAAPSSWTGRTRPCCCSAPGSAPPRCSPCSRRWRRSTPIARSGGCTARAAVASTRSPPRPGRSSRRSRTPRPRALQPSRAGRRRGPRLRHARAAERVGARRARPTADAVAYICGPTPFMDELSAGLAASGTRRITDPHRALRARAGADAGHRGDARAAAAPAGRRARERPDDRVRPQRPRHPVERRLHEPARARRGLRRARPLVVPHRRLPQLRDDADRRRPRLQPRPVEPPAEGSALICCSQPRDDVVLDL